VGSCVDLETRERLVGKATASTWETHCRFIDGFSEWLSKRRAIDFADCDQTCDDGARAEPGNGGSQGFSRDCVLVPLATASK